MEKKAISNNYCGENLAATFTDAVSTIPNLLQSATSVLTKCDNCYEVWQNTPPPKHFFENPSIRLKTITAKSVRIAFSSIHYNEFAWLYR